MALAIKENKFFDVKKQDFSGLDLIGTTFFATDEDDELKDMIEFTSDVDPNHWIELAHKLKLLTEVELHEIKIQNQNSKSCFHSLLKILLERSENPWTDLMTALQAMGQGTYFECKGCKIPCTVSYEEDKSSDKTSWTTASNVNSTCPTIEESADFNQVKIDNETFTYIDQFQCLVADGLILKPLVLSKILSVDSVESLSVGLSSKRVPVIRVKPKKGYPIDKVKATVIKELEEAIWELHKCTGPEYELDKMIEIDQEEKIAASIFERT